MSFLIDRRTSGRHKSAVNRQRFLRRYRDHVRKAVADAVSRRHITDMDQGERVTIPAKDVAEPVFGHGPGGVRGAVHPGNKEFVAGDRIKRPGGGGGRGGGASDSGEGEDDFVFEITRNEFLDALFEDLELPNLEKRRLKGDDSFKYVHAGITSDGVPAKLDVVRSLRTAKARRIGLTSSTRRQLARAEACLEGAVCEHDPDTVARLTREVQALRARVARVPFLDTMDLRYRLHVKQPIPTSQAVMLCLMDVSGSMDQRIKDLAKRFYFLLYTFLRRSYDRTEVVFIRHHTVAKEVDEQEFFYSRETGGTVVSSALKLMDEVVRKRYPLQDWNVYGAQASDGDNWPDDSPRCRTLLAERVLPTCQYYAYVEIAKRPQSLWQEYEAVRATNAERFALARIHEASDIYPVFRELFARKAA